MYIVCTCVHVYIVCTYYVHVHTMYTCTYYAQYTNILDSIRNYKIVMISKGTTTMYDVMCHHVSVATTLVVIATTYSEWIENSWALKY